jgi:hypothetical protein
VIDPNTTTPVLVNVGKATKQKINDFALDANGNFYCAGKNGIMFIKAVELNHLIMPLRTQTLL